MAAAADTTSQHPPSRAPVNISVLPRIAVAAAVVSGLLYLLVARSRDVGPIITLSGLRGPDNTSIAVGRPPIAGQCAALVDEAVRAAVAAVSPMPTCPVCPVVSVEPSAAAATTEGSSSPSVSASLSPSPTASPPAPSSSPAASLQPPGGAPVEPPLPSPPPLNVSSLGPALLRRPPRQPPVWDWSKGCYPGPQRPYLSPSDLTASATNSFAQVRTTGLHVAQAAAVRGAAAARLRRRCAFPCAGGPWPDVAG